MYQSASAFAPAGAVFCGAVFCGAGGGDATGCAGGWVACVVDVDWVTYHSASVDGDAWFFDAAAWLAPATGVAALLAALPAAARCARAS